MATIDVLDANSELFQIYITWCGILLIKTLLMCPLTVYHRRKNKVSKMCWKKRSKSHKKKLKNSQAMANPEDCCLGKDFEVKTHEDVERCRRAHLNDLENVVPFLIISLLFIFTQPHVGVTCWLFRIVGVTRILHTIVYAIHPLPQPARAICHYIPYIISLYMALSAIVYFFRL